MAEIGHPTPPDSKWPRYSKPGGRRQREGGDEVILHSDRGAQFVSDTYQQLLGSHALV